MTTYSARKSSRSHGGMRGDFPLGNKSNLAEAQKLAAEDYRQHLSRPCGNLTWPSNAAYAAEELAKGREGVVSQVWYLNDNGQGTGYSVRGDDVWTAELLTREAPCPS